MRCVHGMNERRFVNYIIIPRANSAVECERDDHQLYSLYDQQGIAHVVADRASNLRTVDVCGKKKRKSQLEQFYWRPISLM